MESPTGIIPEHLIDAGMKRHVIDLLMARPWPGDFKLQVLYGWGIVTGCPIYFSDAQIVHASGWDIRTNRGKSHA
jgi:hypothetical protein